jgi:CBS domain-containing protein
LSEGRKQPIAVSAIMNRNPLTVSPETPTVDAIALMRRERVDCLPVVKSDRLVGIVTERDFINVAARLLERTTTPRPTAGGINGDHELSGLAFGAGAHKPGRKGHVSYS